MMRKSKTYIRILTKRNIPVVYFQVVLAEECFMTCWTLDRAFLSVFRCSFPILFIGTFFMSFALSPWSLWGRARWILRHILFISSLNKNIHTVTSVTVIIIVIVDIIVILVINRSIHLQQINIEQITSKIKNFDLVLNEIRSKIAHNTLLQQLL